MLPSTSILQIKCDQLRPRRLEQHLSHCYLIGSGEPSFSKEYGVNRLSILNDVPQIDLCLCIPHDIMHVLVAGVLPHHCKTLLHHYIIDQHLFTAKQLNKQIEEFAYGYSEKVNAPHPLHREPLTSDVYKLVQSGTPPVHSTYIRTM